MILRFRAKRQRLHSEKQPTKRSKKVREDLYEQLNVNEKIFRGYREQATDDMLPIR